MLELAASLFVFLALVVSLFQAALALGAPWGQYAMGGTHPGTYPPKLRLTAIAQGLLIAFTALIVFTKADLFTFFSPQFVDIAIWFVVVLMGISCVLNLISKSKWERRIWVPVTILLLITSLVVALG